MTALVETMESQNAWYAEAQLRKYARDTSSVSPAWRRWFDERTATSAHPPRLHKRSVFNPAPLRYGAPGPQPSEAMELQERVDNLIHIFREFGHLGAKLDPLGIVQRDPEELTLGFHGITPADIERECSTRYLGGHKVLTVGEIERHLRESYCGYFSAQFTHLADREQREWIRERLEATDQRSLTKDQQLRILAKLTDAEVFETFVRQKYVGSKAFSLAGTESLVPLLDIAIERAAESGIDEIVIGMAHRGRLNVLANIIGKRPLEIFQEFHDPRPELHRGRGDVKYHLGASGDCATTSGTKLHLSLCFNPSHLEFVDAIALGRMRAKQDRIGDRERKHGMVILVHGDAAFAGAGIAQEALNLGQLPPYRTGGVLHVVVNNQVGFTTTPAEGRATIHPSDVARASQIPIFHVNGDQPDAIAKVVGWAMDFRERFQHDVVIDMFCYRRWGHNEGDEPRFTQPLMYDAIDERKSVRTSYLNDLRQRNLVTRKAADEIVKQRYEQLRTEFELAQKKEVIVVEQRFSGVWRAYFGG